MLRIQLFREKPDLIRKSEKIRGHDLSLIDKVIKYDKLWREAVYRVEELKAKRNKVSKEINELKKAGKNANDKIKSMKKVADNIQKQDRKIKKLLVERDMYRKQIGNLLHKSVPRGKDDSENVPIKHWGKKPKFKFQLRDHIELGEINNLFEFDTAAQAAGTRFVYFKNEAALLDLALQQFAVDYLKKQGFSMIWPPMMLNKKALSSAINLSEFKDTIYKIEGEDLYLIGTSEHPLLSLRMNQLIPEEDLPIKVGGISACFRKEAGSHGRDTKGIFRMHQFNKIEQVIYCKPEDSRKYFDEMQRNSEQMFKLLGLPFRVVNICTGDLGNKQHLQYDIELWMPGQNDKKGAYREETSCSNCLDYQAESFNTKFLRKKTGKKEYVHMLNNTAIATPRAIIAILENFQQKDGSIKIPQVLWKYTGFKMIKPRM